MLATSNTATSTSRAQQHPEHFIEHLVLARERKREGRAEVELTENRGGGGG
jgi:hypothetical protein